MAGERVPLDVTLQNGDGTFNAAALTGESVPMEIASGKEVLAGMINEGNVVELIVTKVFGESSLSRILQLVQNAQGRKARTELFIRKFARIYTPVVVILATLVVLLPWFFVENYVFDAWLYRALIFLVISCPCALVVAIPLGYVGGIGAASRNGVLFKGSSYLDRSATHNAASNVPGLSAPPSQVPGRRDTSGSPRSCPSSASVPPSRRPALGPERSRARRRSRNRR